MLFAAILGVQIFRNPLVSPPPTTEATVIRSYPHDPSAFTQGLFFEPGGTLLESTGLYGESSIRRVELDSGRVIKRLGLESDDWFGEGVTVQGGRCLQLLLLQHRLRLRLRHRRDQRQDSSLQTRSTMLRVRSIRCDYSIT